MTDGRRLSDAIVTAHEVACEEGKKEIASLLIEALEMDLSAIGGRQVREHRNQVDYVEQAFVRHEKTFGDD